MTTLLVVDDEPSILHAFGRVFDEEDVTLLTAPTAAQGIEMVTQHRPDVVILDLNLPDQSGLDTFRRIHEFDARIPVIFITGHGTTETAIKAIQLGAFDYIFKPLKLDKLRELVGKAVEISKLMRVPAVISDEQPSQEETADVLVGRCELMKDVYKQIGRVASQDVTVLILGESGTGKELVARAIWNHSLQSSRPFQTINCAAIPEALLESELFGYEKGAFTGADRQRIGKFEQCSDGTLFLDEIGDMTPAMQAKMLRVLQDQQFERVGGNQTVQTNVRLIAATNRDLAKLVDTGSFRKDLYYRLTGFVIELPPLRDRTDDVALLAEYFVNRFGRKLGKDVHEIAPETLDILNRFSWPGNVRELQSVVKQALLQATGPVLVPEFLPPLVCSKQAETADSESTTANGDSLTVADFEQFVRTRLQAGSKNIYVEALALVERNLFAQVLHHTGGNQLQAAEILGIARSTLRSKLRSLDLTVAQVLRPDA